MYKEARAKIRAIYIDQQRSYRTPPLPNSSILYECVFAEQIRILTGFRLLDNLPAVTNAIRPVLGEYYNFDSTVVYLELTVSMDPDLVLHTASHLCSLALLYSMYFR